MAEYWDLFDKDRNPLGKTVERGCHDGCAAYHVVVFVIVTNSKGEYFITKRHPGKHFGGKWEFTGGSVLAGESSIEAALRETKEETGIDHTNSEKQFIETKIILWDDKELGWHGDFDDIWIFKKDFDLSEVQLQEGETTDAKWVTKQELLALIESNQFASTKVLDIILSPKEETNG